MPRLDGIALPKELSWLKDVQFRKFDNANADADLATIAAELVEFVPGLEDRTKVEAPQQAAVDNSARDVRGNMINITGNHGPVHGGRGAQFNGPTTYYAGREGTP
jgi:hypothetical protein